MPQVTVNGVSVEVDKGTTILRAAAVAGFDIPHFCYHPALSSPANCRMCLVEVEGQRKLLPGCYNPVADGMVIKTESDEVVKARKAVLEFILVNHPVDCPICDKAGECKLQDYYFAYDAQESRVRTEKQHKVKAYPIGPRVVYDGERCILCTRCIRFCEEIPKTSELTLADRGDKIEVRTFPGMELDNDYSLCVVDVCPVGALTSRDFRFKCRVWLLTSTESICTGCATGCNIHLDHFRNEVQRYRPRTNPNVNDYWMCDDGRLSYKDIHSDRLTVPVQNGAEERWHKLTQGLAKKLQQTIKKHGEEAVAFVVTPQASCEDLFTAREFRASIMPDAPLFAAGRGTWRGDELLRHTDANPNRAGMMAIFGEDAPQSFDALMGALEGGEIKAVYMMGTDTPCDADTRARFVELLGEKVDLFVLQSMHRAELADKAHIALPTTSHAEEQGTFVNADGLAQSYEKAFSAQGDSMPDWGIFMSLARVMGQPLAVTSLGDIQDKMFSTITRPQRVTIVATESTPAEPTAEAAAPAPAAPAAPAKEEAPAAAEEAKEEEGDDSEESSSRRSPARRRPKTTRRRRGKKGDDGESDGDEGDDSEDEEEAAAPAPAAAAPAPTPAPEPTPAPAPAVEAAPEASEDEEEGDDDEGGEESSSRRKPTRRRPKTRRRKKGDDSDDDGSLPGPPE